MAAAAYLAPEDSDVLVLQKEFAEAEALSFAAAMTQLQSGELAKALPLLRKVIAAAEAVGALKAAAHAHSYMGIALQQQGDILQAIKCHERHLHIAKGLASTAESVRALSNLSSAHQLNGGHEQAIKYHTLQAELINDDTSPADLCSIYGNMSRAYQSAGQVMPNRHMHHAHYSNVILQTAPVPTQATMEEKSFMISHCTIQTLRQSNCTTLRQGIKMKEIYTRDPNRC